MKTKKLAEIDDNTDENSRQNIKLDFNDDYRYFGRSTFGVLIQDEYCKCGRVRSAYEEKLPSPRCDNIYEMGKLANDVFDLDKSAIFLTKKSLMLNQFLEYNESAKGTTIHVDDNTANRFGLNTSKKKCHLKSATFDVQVAENKTTQTLCLSSSVFSDKRLVSLFRSVALYWFFCLNTVLAKGEVFKRKTLTAFELQRGNPAFAASSNLELQILPDLLENFNDLNNDFLWNVVLNERSRNVNSLLSYAEHSKEKLIEDLFKKVLANVAKCKGILRGVFLDLIVGKAMTRMSDDQAAACSSTATREIFDMLDVIEMEYCQPVVASFKTGVVMNKSKFAPETEPRNDRTKNRKRKFCFVDDTPPRETAPEADENFPSVTEDVRGDDSDDFLVLIPEDICGNFDDYVDPLLEDEFGILEGDCDGRRETNTADAIPENEFETTDGVAAATSKSSPEIEDAYFLPEGMLNAEEKTYPEYDLWRSPLIAEQVIKKKKPKMVPSPKVEPSMPIFKPYRLWESSFAAEEDRIPNFRNAEYFSVFSMPYYSHETRRQTRPEQPSVYNLWGSPNIIEFLPRRGGRISDNDRSSRSSSSSDSLEHDANEMLQVLKTRRHENIFLRGKFLNFRPIAARFVSFTDRGAFKYYRKPEYVECRDVDASVVDTDSEIDTADSEVKEIVDGPPKNDAEMCVYFKPIQPAFKVDTDMPANIERSESGTLYHNKRKLMTFKHETDSKVDPHDLFHPKFAVSDNDVACQTERYGCTSRMGFSSRCDQAASPYYASSNNETENREQQYVSDAAFFCTLEEVFNFLGKPDLGNIDVRAPVDFSCMF